MKKNICILFSLMTVMFWGSCKQTPSRYEIIDCKYNPKNNLAAYSVYTPDTNWDEMEKFAKDLLKDKHKHSRVYFFNPREKAIKFEEDWAFQRGIFQYVVATYFYNMKTNQLEFKKDITRFRKDMHFEK